MRITSGRFKGRILTSPEGLSTRPTSDRARQAVFNILMHAGFAGPDSLIDAHVIDVFAGTGALGLEALSRGAADAVFIEEARPALSALRQNIRDCRAEGDTLVIASTALSPPPRGGQTAPRSLLFCDPPYNKTAAGDNLGMKAVTALAASGWLAPGCLCVMEMAKAFPEPAPQNFTLCDTRDYGVAQLRFLRWQG